MELISPREHTFHTICGCILHAVPAFQVNFINDMDDEFSWLNNQTFKPTPSPGNGEGLPA